MERWYRFRKQNRRKVLNEDPERNNEDFRLSELRKGDKGEILYNGSKGQIRRRLLDMGIVKGVKFSVVRKAPLGDPIEIKINGFLLSLRLEEALEVHIKLMDK